MQFNDTIITVRPWPVDHEGDIAKRIAKVRDQGIFRAGTLTRQHCVTLGWAAEDGGQPTGQNLRGSGTLIKWKERPFILTCGHVLKACGLPENDRAPWRLWVVFNGETEANETLAGALQLRADNWWAQGTDAHPRDTTGPDIALVAVPYELANEWEATKRATIRFHDVKVGPAVIPADEAAIEEDLATGIVLHVCGAWHGRAQTEVDKRYTGEQPVATGFTMNLSWPSEFEGRGWTYGDYQVVGSGITQRMAFGRGSPEVYREAVRAGVGESWGGFSGSGVWRVECDSRENARGVRASLAGVVFAELTDDEFSKEVAIGLRAHARSDIFRALTNAEQAGVYSNEEW